MVVLSEGTGLYALTDGGCVLGRCRLTNLKRGILDLHIEIDPARRGEGLVNPLLEAATEFARERGYGALRSVIRKDNLRALAVAARSGFSQIGASAEEVIFLSRFQRAGAFDPGEPVAPVAGDASLCLRPLNPGDAASAQAFFDRMSGLARSFFNRGDCNGRAMRAYLEGQMPNAVYWKLDDAGAMAGCVFLLLADTKAPILGIAVDDACAGRGLGGALLRHALWRARSQGCGGVCLTTAYGNERARRLYEKSGFEPQGECWNERSYLLCFPRSEETPA